MTRQQRIDKLTRQSQFTQKQKTCTLADFYARVTPAMTALLFEPQPTTTQETIRLFQKGFRQ